MNRIKKWIDKLLGKVYYLPKEYRTHLPPEKSDESTTVDPIYENMTKRELETYAHEKFNVNLDRRHNKKRLLNQIHKLEKGK